MARHVWESKRVTARMVEYALAAYNHWRAEHRAAPLECLRFAGYVCERVRQSNVVSAREFYERGAPTRPSEVVSRLCANAADNDYLFARGRNARNYLAAGAMILAGHFGFARDVPPEALADALSERGG